MKKLLLTLSLLAFTTNAHAINFGDTLKEIGKGQGADINKNIDAKVDKVIGNFQEKIDAYEKEARGELDKYKANIEKEARVRGMIDEAEKAVDKLKEIKAKAAYYINLAKIVLAVLSSSILVLIFVMWRIWRNIVGFKRIIRNVTNYDDIEKRLKAVEKQLAQK